MSIKGFIGFWGNPQKNSITKSLFDKYELAIYNGVSFCEERYAVVFSKEYLGEQEQDKILFKSGKDSVYSGDELLTTIQISNTDLSIVRDRWGTRTVYYVIDDENIYFASDIRFLLEIPLDNIKNYDEESLLESATLGYIYNDEGTLFKRIKQLPRNCVIQSQENIFKVSSSIITSNKSRFNSFEEASKKFEEAFENSVADTCNMNGKRAYLLSGGMDSSSIAIAASKKEKIDTISFSSGSNSDDVYYAGRLAEYINSNHLVVEFDDKKALEMFPAFLNVIENVEMDGIFSPLGGYAYFLLCQEVKNQDYDIVFPGEGADEILGGYYWELTHTFGFVDKLKEKTAGTDVYNRVVKLFPEIEERNIYREIAYYLLQGTALTNYHLSCVEHIAKSFGLYNYPIFMTEEVSGIVKDIPMEWLCDGEKTKLILRRYLTKHLEKIGLSDLFTRKKLAMPSVVTNDFYEKLNYLALKEVKVSNNPFKEILGNKPLNIFMLDVFHKYYTLNPLKSIDIEVWKKDLVKVENGECIIHW